MKYMSQSRRLSDGAANRLVPSADCEKCWPVPVADFRQAKIRIFRHHFCGSGEIPIEGRSYLTAVYRGKR